MTLTEARRILERYNAWRRYDGPLEQTPTQPEPKEIGEAIDLAISVLPEDRPRKTASQRLAEIRQGIRETFNGFDPFAKRTRLEEHVFWRYAVFYKMSLEGFMYTQIGRVSGYNHATVWTGIHSLMTSMEIGYAPAIKVWNELIELLEDDD